MRNRDGKLFLGNSKTELAIHDVLACHLVEMKNITSSESNVSEIASDMTKEIYGQISFTTANGISVHQVIAQTISDAWIFAVEVLGAESMIQYRIANEKIVHLR